MATEKRLIDANDAISKLEDELHMCKPVSMDDGYIEEYKKRVIPKLLRNVIDWLKNQPTVDAIEVIRCHNCQNSEVCKIRGKVWCKRMGRYMKEDGFCSEGVAK